MDISCRRADSRKFIQVLIKMDNNLIIDLGLLDKVEAQQLLKEINSMAEELIDGIGGMK